MLFLLLSIICSVLIGFIFKLYNQYGVDNFQAIVFNYITCVLCGWAYLGAFPIGPAADDPGLWLPYATGLGIFFIGGFTCAALTVKYFGVTISQIMQKMSILVTVPFALVVYHESANIWKITGVVLALASIILVNWPQKNTQNDSNGATSYRHLWWIPLLTWMGAGVIEVTFLWVKGEGYVSPDNVRFISTVFGTAFLLGFSFAAWNWLRGTMTFSFKNVIGGVVLGIPNFGSMYFLLLALAKGLEGSFVFPVINVGIIIASTIGAVTLFRERLSLFNWLGIALAVGAIILMAL